jgi:hypothetical protein
VGSVEKRVAFGVGHLDDLLQRKALPRKAELGMGLDLQ